MFRQLALAGVLAMTIIPAAPAAEDTAVPAPIVYALDVPVPLNEAWTLWSTKDGLESFFAAYAEIEPEPLGAFEIWFFPENEPGTRGAEGMRILAAEPEDRLVFTWNAPPHLPHARAQLAAVEVTFDAIDNAHTRVTLTHALFGRHEEWHMTREYFNGAWAVVLNRLAYVAHEGPVDWNNIPQGLSYISTNRSELERRLNDD